MCDFNTVLTFTGAYSICLKFSQSKFLKIMSNQLSLLTKQQLTATILRLNREINCLKTELLRFKIMSNVFERFFNVLQQTRYFDDFINTHQIEANLFREQIINLTQLKSCEIKLNALENSNSSNYIENDEILLSGTNDREISRNVVNAISIIDESIATNQCNQNGDATISSITNNNGSKPVYIYSFDLNTLSQHGSHKDIESVDRNNDLETNEQSDTELSDSLHDNDYLDNVNDYSTNSDSVSGDDSNDTNQKFNSNTKRKTKNKESNESKRYICDWVGCEKSYSLNRSLNDHKRVHSENDRFICDVNGCGKTYITLKAFKHHKQTHSGSVEKRHKCDFDACNFASVSARDLSRHKLTHSTERPYICEYIGCCFSTKQKYALYRHKVRTHSDLFPELDLLTCDFEDCNYTSKLKYDFEQHVKAHTTQLFKCDICDLKFNDISQLDDHMKTHSDAPQYICRFDNCGKSFWHERALEVHSSSHSEKKFACNWEMCGKKFRSKQHLGKHIYKVHKKNLHKQYQCDFENCNKIYKKSDKLKAHRNTHTGDKPYACDWPGCDKRFICQSYLTIHLRYHVNTGNNKIHQCLWPACSYSTNNKNNLSKHNDVHNGLKKHRCDWPGCEFSAANKSNLNSHKKSHV